MEIPGLRGMGPLGVMKAAVREYLADAMPTYASALAFRALFSMFPFLLFLVALLGFLQLTSFFEWLQGIAASVAPAEASGLINEVIGGLQQRKGGLLSFGVLLALWIASAGVRELINALNVAYDVEERRPAWKLYPLSVLYTVGIAASIIAAAALLVLGPRSMAWIATQAGLHDAFVTAWAWLRWPIAFLVLTLAASVIYYAAPNANHRFRLITPGAVFAVAVWILASAAFSYYVANFADYDAMYGSIGAVIVLLMYLFISAAVLLFGAEINAVIAHHGPKRHQRGVQDAAPGRPASVRAGGVDAAPRQR